jgi:nucleotide-binding universal stress UspA family protein
MKRVLVPLDGSEQAESALLPLAQLLAKGDVVALLWIGKPEHLQRVGSSPDGRRGAGFIGSPGSMVSAPPDISVFAETRPQVEERQISEGRDYLERLAAGLRNLGFWVTTHCQIAEHPAEVVVEFARDMKPTFIVMVRRSHFGVGEVLFGSVATRVIEAEVAPVLLVPIPQH